SVGASGELLLNTGNGVMTQSAPVVYQDVGGVRQAVDGHYVLLGGTQVGFAVGAYDRTHALVIDPTFSYSTYLGRSDTGYAADVAIDSSGNAYITGSTISTNFPTTAGAFQTSLHLDR